MKERNPMKKPTFKRIVLGIIQHLSATAILLAVAGIMFNSYVAVTSMNGVSTYWLEPMNTEPEFEDSDLFGDIFKTAVSDITRLVVIKGQIETNGKFDPDKKIDVTRFAARRGNGNGCKVTASYSLENIIKWGRYGVEYSTRVLSLSDFVNYFGEVVSPRYYALDASGSLYFKGFEETAENREGGTALSAEEGAALEEEMKKYTTEQLEDMAFSYIMAQAPESVNVSREDDGTLSVYVQMLACRYETVDGEKQLTAYADNWIDYLKLQSNVEESVVSLTANYQQYQNCQNLYQEENSNIKYIVRIMTEEGLRTYGNMAGLMTKSDNDLTDYFLEYRRYLIYYPDSLEFMGNTSLREDEIYGFMNEYNYAYPESTHVWIGVDTNYSNPGDGFYNANVLFQRLVPNIGRIVSAIIMLAALWLGLMVYLTSTAGYVYDEDGNAGISLNGIDHIWLEAALILCALLAYGAFRGYRELLEIADEVYFSQAEVGEEGVARLYEYGAYGLYGFLLSVLGSSLWYSLVRRIRGRNLWKDSFLHWIVSSIRRCVTFVLCHRNTAISVLFPYNLFLLCNLGGITGAYILREQKTLLVLIIIILVAGDGVVGMLLFKQGAELMDIIEGINRIRCGNADYKLDVDSLHGTSREMADAVNNIGEGIRNAVNTSMKDEQMKTDLITNVSHDLKTPLTSIINYVDLLKRLKIEDEPAKSYINVLDTKSQRLKQLTDDLVEVSKITSGNITLDMEKLNLTELTNQAIGEFSEKLEEHRLQLVFENREEPAYIYADSRRMWRVIENLFNNICKYALEGTRVYLDLLVQEELIELSLKNISERQMNIRPDELTERFIRGDSSRTTEGSGLGLSIAKSLTQAQGGRFAIQVDGDLFKAILTFPVYQEGEEDTKAPVTEKE